MPIDLWEQRIEIICIARWSDELRLFAPTRGGSIAKALFEIM